MNQSSYVLVVAIDFRLMLENHPRQRKSHQKKNVKLQLPSQLMADDDGNQRYLGIGWSRSKSFMWYKVGSQGGRPIRVFGTSNMKYDSSYILPNTRCLLDLRLVSPSAPAIHDISANSPTKSA